MSSLGEEFPKQQKRVRELLTEYQRIGSNGVFGAMALKQILARAEEAMASGDVIKILQSFKAMEGCK